jgi:hypothetical protein
MFSMQASDIAMRTRASARSEIVRRLSDARVTRRGIQIALGIIWLIDGVLQFQTYMYSHAFVSTVLEGAASGQPSFIGDPIMTLARFYGHDPALWNTLAAEVQCLIGLGLIVSKRTVRPALFVSFFWGFIVWWFGEGFGPIVNGSPVSPLMGAPGAVLIYGLIGALVWPRNTAEEKPVGEEKHVVDGGLFGRHGGRAVWTLLWLEAGALWFLKVNDSKTAIHDQIAGMASGSPSWLAGALNPVANSAQGHGVVVATILGVASILIALAVWAPTRPVAFGALALGAALSLAYWIFGQSLGGPFWAGSATDVNAGPLFVLLAVTVAAQPSGAVAAVRSAVSARSDQKVATA